MAKATLWTRPKALGVALMLLCSGCVAGTLDAIFAVKVILVVATGESCTGATGSTYLNIKCSPGVAISVSARSPTASGKFLPGFRPARDSLLPDYCRREISRTDQTARITCRLDDKRQIFASNEVDEGWEIESRLYAVDTEDAATKTARLRLEEQERGILTGVRFASAGGKASPVELLVSF